MPSSPNIRAKPWRNDRPPKRILAIRLQAMGDVVITLPYLQQLRHSLPASVKLDLLTRKETEDIPKSIVLFDKIYSIGGGRDHKRQLLDTFRLLPVLWLRRYDIVIDLQNNFISRIVRKAMLPRAWVEFDKYSPISAGERNRLTIEASCLGENSMNTGFKLKDTTKAMFLLRNNGWNEKDKLVVLNPAGFFETRNWPLENYVRFGELWMQHFPGSKFIALGTAAISKKTAILKQKLGDRFIDLSGQTSPSQAFSILQRATLTVSEDSGLMHMSWVSGIPTIALFGSSRSDWSRPLGNHSLFFDSSDLPCGNCMGAVCRMGDTRCLTRITPEMIIEQAITLMLNSRVSKINS